MKKSSLSERATRLWETWFEALKDDGEPRARRVAGLMARLADGSATVKWVVNELREVGRVLSTANEERLRAALEMIESVLATLGPQVQTSDMKESVNFRAVEDAVRRALRVKFNRHTYIRELYDDAVIFEIYDPLTNESVPGDDVFYRVYYTYEPPDTVEFTSIPERVRRVVTYEPVTEVIAEAGDVENVELHETTGTVVDSGYADDDNGEHDPELLQLLAELDAIDWKTH